jgi:serine/threonine-protein kinase PRP4
VKSEDANPVDEATLIEERRKRREAIKAKYRGQATPLLVQALQLGNKTGPSTLTVTVNDSDRRSAGTVQPPFIFSPTHLTFYRAESATSSPPQTPKDSEPSSPVLTDGGSGFQSGEDLLKQDASIKPASDANAEESSAADYDPTMDMQEDRMKADMRQQGEEVSASSYDETQPHRRDAPLPGSTDTRTNMGVNLPRMGDAVDTKKVEKKKKSADEFDMFAEDFDEDEFNDDTKVPGVAAFGEPGSGAAKTRETMGKQLDASLLDNWDDAEGYYRIILGELLDGRYNVQANLGKGVFSAVVRATDLKKNGDLVAIKIVRANDTM